MTTENRKPAKKDYDLLMANGCEYHNGKEWGYHYVGILDKSTELHLIGRNAVEASDYLRRNGAIEVAQVKAAVEKNRKEIVAETKAEIEAEAPKKERKVKRGAKKVAKKADRVSKTAGGRKVRETKAGKKAKKEMAAEFQAAIDDDTVVVG